MEALRRFFFKYACKSSIFFTIKKFLKKSLIILLAYWKHLPRIILGVERDTLRKEYHSGAVGDESTVIRR